MSDDRNDPDTIIRLTVKISVADKAALERAARAAGDSSVSAVVRKLIRDALNSGDRAA